MEIFFLKKEMFSSPFIRDNIRQVLDSMRAYFKSFFSYSCTAFNISAIRDLQELQGDGSKLNKDGSNFVNVFYSMMNSDGSFKERYLHTLKRMIVKCQDIDIKSVGGKIWMELVVDGCIFPLSEVSDGTIHLLVLLLMLCLSMSVFVSFSFNHSIPIRQNIQSGNSSAKLKNPSELQKINTLLL